MRTIVAHKSREAIAGAARECLARCYRGTTPLGEIAVFIAELREKGWDAEDIKSVEAPVRKVLAGIVSNPIFDENE